MRTGDHYRAVAQRHFADASGLDVLFDFAQNIIQLAASDVAFHLIIPLVILPTVQPRSQLGALFKQKLLSCAFDFR